MFLLSGSLGTMSSRGTLYNEGSSSRSDSSTTWSELHINLVLVHINFE